MLKVTGTSSCRSRSSARTSPTPAAPGTSPAAGQSRSARSSFSKVRQQTTFWTFQNNFKMKMPTFWSNLKTKEICSEQVCRWVLSARWYSKRLFQHLKIQTVFILKCKQKLSEIDINSKMNCFEQVGEIFQQSVQGRGDLMKVNFVRNGAIHNIYFVGRQNFKAIWKIILKVKVKTNRNKKHKFIAL